jgi:hypothetical protein
MSTVEAVRPPNTVALFSGHMIDASDRKTLRFPPDKESAATAAITDALSKIGVTRGDLAICGGACGGDLLFAEACLARDTRLEIYIPFEEPTFLANSVDFGGGNWHDRYLAVKSRATLHARRARPAAGRCECVRAQQSMDAGEGGSIWRRKDCLHLFAEWPGWRWSRRSPALHGPSAA